MKHLIYLILAVSIVFGCFYILDTDTPAVSIGIERDQSIQIDFFVPPQTTLGTPPIISMPSWNLLKDESGVRLYREQGTSLKNFLLIVDPTAADISVIKDFSYLADHWQQAQNPVCVFNGTFFEPDGAPTFPLILDGNLVPGFKTEQFPTRMIYFDLKITVADVSTNADVVQSTWGIGGLNPKFYDEDATITTYSLLAEKDGYLYILITQNRTLAKATSVLTDQLGIDAKNIVALDPGWSVQFRCFGIDYLTSPSIIGSSLVISH